MLRIFLAFSLFAEAACPLYAVSPDPKTLIVPPGELSKSRELVHKLGSEEYAEREEAEQALAKMGRMAWPALLEGLNANPSPEVRHRCEALLPKATALEMKARFEVFLADVDGKYEHDLPGWNQFRAVVCNEWNLFGHRISADRSLEKAARSVFVELFATSANRNVVMATSPSTKDLDAVVVYRRRELGDPRRGRIGKVAANAVARREPTAEDVAALLFAESLARQTKSQGGISSVNGSTSAFSSQVLRTDEKGKVYKAIVSAWMESRADPLDLFEAMRLAPAMGLSKDLSSRLAARLFAAQKAPFTVRGNAAMALARTGGREHIPLLEKSFEDVSVEPMTRPNIGINNNVIQIRDIALAVSIQLAGEKLTDYGFIEQFKANAGEESYSYTRFYLPNEKRAEAFEKWKKWWAKNKSMRD
jgi:hypothetical protein